MAGKRILVYGSMGDIAGTVATSLRNRGLKHQIDSGFDIPYYLYCLVAGFPERDR